MELVRMLYLIGLLVYNWLRAIVLFFIPRRLRTKDVTGRVILITGGGSGLGRLLAVRFAARGARVVVWDINESALQATVDTIQARRQFCKSYVCDISKAANVYATADRVRADVGSVHILINNAGVVCGKSFLEEPDEKIRQGFDVNILAHCWTCKAFLPDMIAEGSGQIVSVSSMAAYTGAAKLVDYSATKAAAVIFQESLALEMEFQGHHGIQFTTISPFFMNTGMFNGVYSSVIGIMEPEDVADESELGILTNQDQIFMPRLIYFLYPLKPIMPIRSQQCLHELLGSKELMAKFTGRQNGESINNNVDNNRNSILTK